MALLKDLATFKAEQRKRWQAVLPAGMPGILAELKGKERIAFSPGTGDLTVTVFYYGLKIELDFNIKEDSNE